MELLVQPFAGGIDNGRPRPLPVALKKLLPRWLTLDYREYPDGWAAKAKLFHRDFTLHYYYLHFQASQQVQIVASKPTIALQFTLQGNALGKMAGGGHIHILKEGTAGIFYLVPGANLATIGAAPFISFHVEFTDHLLEELSRDLKDFNEALTYIRESPQAGLPLVTFPLTYELRQLINQFLACDGSADAALKLKTQLLQLLVQANSSILEDRSTEDLPHSVYKETLLQIKQAISNDPNIKMFSLETLARQYHIEPSTISRQFHYLFKIHFMDYLRLRVMEKALLLIIDTERTITEIADELGYNSKSNFTRAFFRYYQATPSQVRKDKGLPGTLRKV